MKKQILPQIIALALSISLGVGGSLLHSGFIAERTMYYIHPLSSTTASIRGIKNICGNTLELPSYDKDGRRIIEVYTSGPSSAPKEDLEKVTHVILPDHVENIGGWLFTDLPSLEEITLGKYQKEFDIRGIVNPLYNKNNGYKINLPEENVYFKLLEGCLVKKSINADNAPYTLVYGDHIPEGVTEIGDRAFYANSGIQEITVPGRVKSIGKYAFSEC